MTVQRGLIRTVEVLFISLVVFLVLASPAEAKGTTHPSLPLSSAIPDVTCVTAMDNPHISTGAGGVIAKLRYCTEDALSETDSHLYLYLCPNPPTGDEDTWGNQGCVLKANTSYIIYTPRAFTTYTRYVPPSGQPGAHGTGWWIACSTIMDFYSGGGNATYTVISSAVYISA